MKPSNLAARPLALGLVLVCAPLLRVAEGAPAAVQEEVHGQYVAILAARGALVKRLADRLAADAKVEPALDVSLTLSDAIVRRSEEKGVKKEHRADLECLISRRGGKWFVGTGRAKAYNLAQHDVDASEVDLAGDRLSGTLKATLNPDPWVPPDHRPKHIRYEIQATVSGGEIAGTFTADGDYGPAQGAVAGRAAAVREEIVLPTLAEEADLPAEPLAACVRMAVLASRAYQQSRAAVLSLRHYPLSFARTLEVATLAVPEWPASEESLPEVCDYLAAVRRLLEREIDGGTEGDAFVVETLEVADPFFGPYFGDEALPVDAEGVAVLPADVGAGESQRWQRIPRWRTLAAFVPDPRRDIDTSGLPEIVPAAGARYKPNAERLGAGYAMPEGGFFTWVDHEAPFRFIPPPGQPFDPVSHHRSSGQAKGAHGVRGLQEARWYGVAEVESDRDVELYASAFGQEYGKLWVNDDLVWVSRQEGGNGCVDPPLLKVRLRKGRNTFLFCCQSRRAASYFWVMLCTGGKPLPAEDRARRREAQRAATASLSPDPRRGRRGDWTGRFPDADPPLAWNLHDGTNVLWRTPLPSYSAANPVIVGDRLFVNCEPHTLYCLDKNTGKILWKRDSHIMEFAPEDQREAAMQAWEEGYAAEGSPERKKLTHDLAALEDELRQLEEAGHLTEAKERETQAKIAEVEAQLKELESSNRTYNEWSRKLGVRQHGWSNNYGWTFPAPCSDGKHVWVKHNTGVLACYDLDGKRRWMERTHMSGGVEQLPSPVLADGKVIIQGRFTDREQREALAGSRGSPPYFGHRLAAYDQETGDLAWERPIWASGGYGCPGGIAPMCLSDGRATRELVVTGTGLVIDPRDGSLLTSALGVGRQGYYGDPFVAENRLYLYRSGPVWAAEVWLEPDGRVGGKLVVEAPRGGGNAGAVYRDGYVFGTNVTPVKGRHAVPSHDVHVADMRTGEVIGSLEPALFDGGLAYTPSASTRTYGVVVGTGPGPASWSISNNPAEIGFIVPGPKPYVVNTCKLDGPMVAQPVFEGRRMYARTYQAVLCIGIKGPEGEQYALREKAKTLLVNLPKRPKVAGVPAPSPLTDFKPAEGVPVEACATQTAPQKWLFVGPFARDAAQDPLADLGGPAKAVLVPGQEVSAGEDIHKVAPLDEKFVDAQKGWAEDIFGRRYYSARCGIDVLGAIGRRQESITYYYAVLENRETRFVEVEVVGGKGISLWVGGEPVESGSRLRLVPGHYPVLLAAEIAKVPPFIAKALAGCRLRDVEDPNVAYATWRATVAEARPRLEEVVRELPDTAEARSARAILESLNGEE